MVVVVIKGIYVAQVRKGHKCASVNMTGKTTSGEFSVVGAWPRE